MSKQVKITANKEGQVFVANEKMSVVNGKEVQLGYYRVEELEPRIDNSGIFARVLSPRSALKPISKTDFEKAKGYFTDGRLLDGQIVSIDSTEKLGNRQQKTAGEGGVALTHNGLPLYNHTEFTSDMTKTDIKIISDRGLATAAAKVASKVSTSAGLAE